MSNTQAPESNGEAVVIGSDEVIDTAPEASDDNSFEVDAIQRRVAARKIAREAERRKKEAEDELKRHLLERAMRAKNRPAPVVEPSVWSKIHAGALAVIKSKTTHNALAYGSLALMVAGVGVYVYQLNSERVAAAFREHCRENNMKYAIGSRMYCYDDGRFAHKITDNGVAARMDLDWTINQRELRLAFKAADRAAASVASPVIMTPVVKPTQAPAIEPIALAPNPLAATTQSVALIVAKPNGFAAGHIQELASQLARNDSAAADVR